MDKEEIRLMLIEYDMHLQTLDRGKPDKQLAESNIDFFLIQKEYNHDQFNL